MNSFNMRSSLGAPPPNPRSLTHWGNQKGQREKEQALRPAPPSSPCLGARVALQQEPYPPGRQAKSNNFQGTMERNSAFNSKSVTYVLGHLLPLSPVQTKGAGGILSVADISAILNAA